MHFENELYFVSDCTDIIIKFICCTIGTLFKQCQNHFRFSQTTAIAFAHPSVRDYTHEI